MRQTRKIGWTNTGLAVNGAEIFEIYIIGAKFGNRQTNRQTDKFFDTIYGGMFFFLSVKFATFLLASLAGVLKRIQIQKKESKKIRRKINRRKY